MTAVDWEEVKRLAADFQRAQLTSTSQALSERNCVEIVTKLIESGSLDVVFTTDGKEYITPQYLVKEITDELYVSGGRINLVELSKTLNVDLSHISAKIPEVERSVPGCIILMGQLITKSYQQKIAEEITDRLQRVGQVVVGDLTKVYDLPGDFLQNVIEKNLGKTIQAKQDKSDSRVFYTEAFVEKNKSILRGALRGLTQPTQVSAILNITNLSERDFIFAYDLLLENKDMCGVLTAKQSNGVFIPHVHTKQQNEWVENFYKNNGYLEYDALSRLGISDPVSFVRRHFPGSGMLELPTCVIGSQLLSQVDASVSDTLMSGSFLDVMMLVPSVFSPSDVSTILTEVLKKNKSKSLSHVFSDTVLITQTFLDKVSQPFYEGVLKEKAEKCVSSGAYLQAHTERRNTSAISMDTKTEKRDERRKKAAGGKSGGGTQGRETKTKSTKKKYLKGKDHDDSDSDPEPVKPSATKLELITSKEIEKGLKSDPSMQDLIDIDGVVEEISKHLQPFFNKKALELASDAYEKTLVSSVTQRKQLHGDLQEKIDSWLMEIRLSEKGIKFFQFEDTKLKLSSHLLKNIGTEVVNALLLYASEDPNVAENPKDINPQVRNKMIAELSGETKEVLVALNKSISGSSIDEFLNAVEPTLISVGLLNRKPDKKKEKQFLQSKREQLLKEVTTTESPSVLLHNGLLLIFQSQTQTILNASGKFVPAILNFLQPLIPSEFYSQLVQFHDLVSKLLTVGDDEEVEAKLKIELNDRMPGIKESIITFRKSSSGTDKN